MFFWCKIISEIPVLSRSLSMKNCAWILACCVLVTCLKILENILETGSQILNGHSIFFSLYLLSGYSATAAFEIESSKLIQKFVEQVCKVDYIKEKVEQASNIPREILIQETENNVNNCIQRMHFLFSNFSFFLKSNWEVIWK